MPFTRLMKEEDIPLGEARAHEISQGEWVAVFHTPDGFFAIDDVCSHGYAALSEGTLRGDVVTCPRHGGKVNVKTGMPAGFPVAAPVKSYPLKVEDGDIFVDLGT